jgi:hypothetical protein
MYQACTFLQNKVSIKDVLKVLVKLTSGINFINILPAALLQKKMMPKNLET